MRAKHQIRLGVHTSISGGVSKAVERSAALKCTTMQIFSHSPRQWRQSSIPKDEAERFKTLREKYDINPVYVHASYLINLASLSKEVLNKSIKLLAYEMRIADQLKAEYVVLHTGSAGGENEGKARKKAVKSMVKALSDGRFSSSVILENTAGKRGDITSSIQTLAEIIDSCNSKYIAGICVDTCHAFCSGYNLSLPEGVERLMNEVKKYVGFDKLKLIHLNDSKRQFGSGVDRHAHIGKGFIGMKGFKNILSETRISRVPLILETPKSSERDDKRNLQKVHNILKNIKV